MHFEISIGLWKLGCDLEKKNDDLNTPWYSFKYEWDRLFLDFCLLLCFWSEGQEWPQNWIYRVTFYMSNRVLLFAAYAYGVNSTIRHVVAYLCRINYIKSADYIFHLVPTKDQACCTICVVFRVCSVALNEVIDRIYRWPCSTSRFRFSVLIGRYRFDSRDIENTLSNFQLRTFSSVWARTLNRALIWL